MKKNIFMALVVLAFMGCSEKEASPKTPVNERVEIRTISAENTVPTEFIPEHIRRSNIEVVKHH